MLPFGCESNTCLNTLKPGNPSLCPCMATDSVDRKKMFVQDLDHDVQDKIIASLDQGSIPMTDDPRITMEVVKRWYAD